MKNMFTKVVMSWLKPNKNLCIIQKFNDIKQKKVIHYMIFTEAKISLSSLNKNLLILLFLIIKATNLSQYELP